MTKISKAKEKTTEIFDAGFGQKGFIYVIDDYIITGLIILNIIAIIMESFQGIHQEYKAYFDTFDLISVIVFTIEYILRVWIADSTHKSSGSFKSRLKYIFSPLGLVDLMAILPFYISAFDLRILRALRLLKLAHYFPSLKLIGQVLKDKMSQLAVTIFATFIVILLTSSLMYHIEHDIQPEIFPNILQTFWWAIATLTTIGYGDVYPVTGLGQMLAAITALFGIGLVAIPTGIIAMGFMDELEKKKAEDKEEEDYNYCPHCGKKLKE